MGLTPNTASWVTNNPTCARWCTKAATPIFWQWRSLNSPKSKAVWLPYRSNSSSRCCPATPTTIATSLWRFTRQPGQEASLFAGDLYRMYQRYAQVLGWAVEILDSNPSDLGGFNRIAFSVDGQHAYSQLKFEAGVHRVQRVPETETQGRIHTSTVTVAVLPQADEVEVDIKDDDLRIDIYHAGGHGGQNVNKVATAVRIVHEPSGLVVVCQDERSQYKNKSKAMTILRSRLFAAEQNRQQVAISTSRKAQIGSGDRSEKMRTYNYPQDRITDHRIGSSVHGIQRVMDGGLGHLIDQLITNDQALRLEAVTA